MKNTGKILAVFLLTLALALGLTPTLALGAQAAGEAVAVGEAAATAGEAVAAGEEAAPRYTVEFTYDEKQYVMPGDSTVALKDILEYIGLDGEVSAVAVSDSALFSASNASGEWRVTAHQAFHTDEWMKVTLDGTVFEIVVTDAATYTGSVDYETIKVGDILKKGCIITRPDGGGQYSCAYLLIPNAGDIIINGTQSQAQDANSYQLNDGDYEVVKTEKGRTNYKIYLEKSAVANDASYSSNTSFTYDGGQKTAVTNGQNVSITGTNTAANAGSYTAYVEPQSGHAWSDGSTTKKTINWTINKASNPLTYTGAQTVTKTFSTSAQTAALAAASNGQGTVTYAINSQPTGSYFSLSGTTLTIKANTPAGTYTVVVRATAEGNSNYNSGTKDSTVTVTVNRANINPSVTMNGWTYGNTESNPSVSGNTGNGTVTYSYKVKGAADGTYTTTKPSNAGTYTVKATVAATTNYNGGTATTDFTIGKRTLTITADSASKTYDTTPLTKNSYTSSGLASGDKIDSVTVNGSQTNAGSSANVPSAAVIKKGTADVTSNYTITYKNGTLTVNKAPITPKVELKDWTYGYDAETPVVKDNPENGEVSYNFKNCEGTAAYDSPIVPTNAGNYTVTATVTETANYLSGTASANFTIERQDVTPRFVEGGSDNNVSFYPDPVPNGIEPVVTIVDAQNHDIPRAEYALAVDKGNHRVIISDQIADGGNYNIATATINYPYTVGTAVVSTPPTAASRTYTGEPQMLLATPGEAKRGNDATAMVYFVSRDADYKPDADTEWQEIAEFIIGVPAGKYYVWYKALGDGGHDYNDSTPVCIPVTIQKATLTVTANDKTITYCDAPSANGVTYSGFQYHDTESVLKGELSWSYTYSVGGDVKADADKDYGTFEIIPYGLSADNYAIEYVRGALTVNKKPVTLEATAADKTYDGNTTATITSSTVVERDLYPGDTLTANYNDATATFADAAVGNDKTVTFTGITITGDKVGNYILDAEQTVTNTASILQKDVTTDGSITISPENETLTYNRSPQAPTLTVQDTAVNETLREGTDYTVTYEGVEPTEYENSEDKPTDAGTYYVVLTFIGNYTGERKVPFTIEPKSITGATVTLEVNEWLFTGSERSVKVESVVLDGVTLTAETEYTAEGLTGTVVDTYTVTVTGKDNYKDTATTTWRITKATPDVATPPTAGAITYGQSLADSSLTGGVVKLGEIEVPGTFAWKVTDIEPAVADSETTEYAVVFTPNDTVTYEEVECKVTLKVNKAPSSVVTRPTAKTLPHTGEAQELIDAGTGEGGTMQYSTDGQTYSAEIPTKIEIGSYSVWYKVVGDANHSDTEPEEIRATIIPSSTPGANPGTYDGTRKALVKAGEVSGGRLEYVLGTEDGPTDDWKTEIPTGINAGTYYVWYRIVGDENHKSVDPQRVVATIAKAEITPTVELTGWTYGEEANKPSVGNNPGNGEASYEYSDKADGTYSPEVPSKAGSYYVRAKVEETANYLGGTSVPANFNIGKANVTISAKASSSVYGAKIAALAYETTALSGMTIWA